MFRPKFAEVIHPKKAEVDTVDFVKVWHDNVHPNTFFLANSWREAVEACKLKDVSAQ
jgi:hypothetical protein